MPAKKKPAAKKTAARKRTTAAKPARKRSAAKKAAVRKPRVKAGYRPRLSGLGVGGRLMPRAGSKVYSIERVS